MQYGPAIIVTSTNACYPLVKTRVLRVGRSRDADIAVTDPSCSRNHFQVVCQDGAFYVESLAPDNPTFCDGQLVEGRVRLSHQAAIVAGETEFHFVGEGEPLAVPPPVAQPTVVAALGHRVEPLAGPIPVVGEMLIGRDPSLASICLSHVQVSRTHARIKSLDGRAILTDLNSANGTFVNGRRLVMPAVVQPGDRIGIGPYVWVFLGDCLSPSIVPDNALLIGQGLCRSVLNSRTGQRKTILDRVSLVVRPREFVCLLGPSGSGKTTLLSALSARSRADEGSVFLNQQDLYANFESLKQDLVVVPQRDILHEGLPVDDALRYTARLRLPPDTTTDEILRRVTETIEMVGLAKHRSSRIRDLSGGQAKRASLANELLANPSLLFLDEVTSGLDEQADRDMMSLFRQVAESGKTVVCVTHNLANVERNCHLVVILGVGGILAFVGSPAEAMEYFHVTRLGDIYDRLSERPPEDWQDDFHASPFYARNVTLRMAGHQPKPPQPTTTAGWDMRDEIRASREQYPTLVHRYFHVLTADVRTLVGTFGQCLLVALLLILVFGKLENFAAKDPLKAVYCGQLLFMMGVSCFWFGC